MSRFVPVLVAALLAAAPCAWAQNTPPREQGAQENVRQSEQYERAVCANAAFRAKRVQQECGSIDDPQMHESCVASFNCGPAGLAKRRHSNKPPPSETVR
jgi:hypothetical protein